MLKSKIHIKIISFCMIAVVLFACISYSTIQVKAAETEKKILVLIQKDNKWIAYDNMVVKSPKNNLMLKATTISKKLGLTYKKVDSKKFTISSGIKTLTFTKGAKNYQYKNDLSVKNYKNTYTPYTAKVDGTSYNLIHYNSLSKLLNVKYFSTKGTEYQGYTGVLTFSKDNKISELPKVNNVLDEKGKAFFIPTSFPTSKPSNSGTINIGGVEVPKLSGFVPANSDTDGWFGADTKDSHPYYDATKKFDEYIIQAMTDLGENLLDEVNTVKYIDNTISISPYGSHSQHQAMSLYKNTSSNQYELTLKVRLYDSKYSTIYKNSLQLLLASFTNDISKLYTVIYDSMETDNLHGLNESTWTSFSNYKIKVDLSTKGEVTYLIKGN